MLVALSRVPVRAGPEAGSELVTELVPGETLAPLPRPEYPEGNEAWLGAVVPDHPSRLDERGYPGWVSQDGSLGHAAGWSPDLMVAAPNEAGLPLGSLLSGPVERPTLPDGKAVEVRKEATVPLDGGPWLSEARLSRSLLGLGYRWGGTDSTLGLDCSGMVYRVMQVLGVCLPRDADDQFDRAPLKAHRWEAHWSEARVGDLVFFGEESVTHVGFYLGGGRYVSAHGAPETGGVVIRSVTEDPYLGFARYRVTGDRG